MVSVRLQYLGVVTVKAVQLKPVPVFIFFFDTVLDAATTTNLSPW